MTGYPDEDEPILNPTPLRSLAEILPTAINTLAEDWGKRTSPFIDLNYQREYLHSEHWRQMRIRALARAGGICQRCKRDQTLLRKIEIFDLDKGTCTSGATLDVHHLRYDRIGHERETDLIVLCRPCHLREHGQIAQGSTEHTIVVRKASK